jgi:hypothetical protein
LTDGGVQVKGNRGQFPRFTAKYCKLPLTAGAQITLVNSVICLRFPLRETRYVIVLNQRLRVNARKVRCISAIQRERALDGTFSLGRDALR